MSTHSVATAPVLEADETRRVRRFANVLLVVALGRVVVAAGGGFPGISRDFSIDSGAAEVLRLAWPLLLALWIKRSNWPGLLIAVTITSSVLVLDRLIAGALGAWIVLNAPGAAGPIGSRWTAAEIGEIGAGIAGVVINALVAFAAWRLARRSRQIIRETPPESRRAIGRRLAIVGAVVFAGLSFGSLAWDAYVDVLSQSPAIRRFVLRSETKDRRLRPRPDASRNLRPPGRLLLLVNDGMRLIVEGKPGPARAASWNALRQIRISSERRDSEELRRDRASIAVALNNLARAFATGPNAADDPELAVKLSRESLRLAPGSGMSWNTLGIALLRASSDREAEAAFQRGMGLREGGDSADWLFLAILRQRAGKTDEAREFFERSLKWNAEHRPNDPELRKFEAEAAEALGLPSHDQPSGDTSSSSPAATSSAFAPPPPRKSARASGSIRSFGSV
jgi:hypothetical protein